jgi:hypothetical protein
LHEDEGMMGQFVVVDPFATAVKANNQTASFNLYPNPANSKLYLSFDDPNTQAYYVKIINVLGKTVLMLPKPQLQQGIDISNLTPGVYALEFTDQKTKAVTTKKFIKE